MNYLFIESDVDTIIIGDLANSVILTGSNSRRGRDPATPRKG
jgi:hypothetical protein